MMKKKGRAYAKSQIAISDYEGNQRRSKGSLCLSFKLPLGGRMWIQAARRPPMVAVPIASIKPRTEIRAILRWNIFSIESSFTSFAPSQRKANFAATVIARPTEQAAKER
jgi:hypothetical protein